MRLRRLDLIRYGHFTDFAIDFGARREKEIDLHIIYGPNEAGKSTLLISFLEFPIEASTISCMTMRTCELVERWT